GRHRRGRAARPPRRAARARSRRRPHGGAPRGDRRRRRPGDQPRRAARARDRRYPARPHGTPCPRRGPRGRRDRRAGRPRRRRAGRHRGRQTRPRARGPRAPVLLARGKGQSVIQRLGLARSPRLAVSLPASLELTACYRYCEALVRARHHNYPVASMFARSQLRKHIFAMFAFARVADDFADEKAYEGRRARELDRWEEQLHAAYRGNADHPVFVALADTVDKFALPITEFTELLSGFRTDLERHRYATFDELRSYTRQATEPIGRLLLYIAGYRAPELHAYADDLSTAVAVARLLQDVPADWQRGRV